MNKKNIFDFIVLGIGGMGSATCVALAKKGFSVLGLDQYSIPHSFGSSHGETRMIRKAYFEHSDYIPLLERSYQLWQELQGENAEALLNLCGLVLYGNAQKSFIYQQSLLSAQKYSIPVEALSASEAQKRWGCYHPFKDQSALYEPSGGFIFCEKALRAMHLSAQKLGVKLHENERVNSYHSHQDSVDVKTNQTTYSAKKLIITGGAWSADLLKDLKIPLKIKKKFLAWYPLSEKYLFEKSPPCFAFHESGHFFYGFPSIDGRSVKIAEHFEGDILNHPEEKNQSGISHKTQELLNAFVTNHLPIVTPLPIKTESCLYTLTPDENFLIDTHPHDKNIIFGAGFSGHGFKFCPVIGEILSDIACEGRTGFDIRFLKLRNFF